MSTPRLPQVQRLIGLARSNGIDVRTTLLRVLVDQFVAERHHPAAEITRFGELCLHLLAKADEADRRLVAEKLADHPETPLAVARRLARDVAPVAAPILMRSQVISDDDMFLAVQSGDPAKALAVARRADLGLAALVALEDFDDPDVRRALAARVGREAPPEPAGPPRPPEADLGERFLAGNPEERESLIAGLVLGTGGAPEANLPEAPPSLEMAALSRREGALGRALAEALRIAPDLAERIASDPHGEPLVVAARALDLGREAATRILLFAHTAIGTNVERVHGLTGLYEVLPRATALALVGSWQAASGAQAKPRTVRHVPVHALDASDRVGARQAATPAGRGGQRRETPLTTVRNRLGEKG